MRNGYASVYHLLICEKSENSVLLNLFGIYLKSTWKPVGLLFTWTASETLTGSENCWSQSLRSENVNESVQLNVSSEQTEILIDFYFCPCFYFYFCFCCDFCGWLIGTANVGCAFYPRQYWSVLFEYWIRPISHHSSVLPSLLAASLPMTMYFPNYFWNSSSNVGYYAAIAAAVMVSLRTDHVTVVAAAMMKFYRHYPYFSQPMDCAYLLTMTMLMYAHHWVRWLNRPIVCVVRAMGMVPMMPVCVLMIHGYHGYFGRAESVHHPIGPYLDHHFFHDQTPYSPHHASVFRLFSVVWTLRVCRFRILGLTIAMPTIRP